ncbi:GroES-like protein [Atractiella rhizophila]|nr:GroES-like protein [Atractiella rhizophila]
MSRTHQAIVHTTIPTVIPTPAPIELRSLPTPQPGRDEVLIRVRYAAISPVYIWHGDWGLLFTKVPTVMGNTWSGVVEELGEGVDGLEKGELVQGFQFGALEGHCFQEFLVANKHNFGKLPKHISLAQGATIGDNLVTAFNTLFTELALPLPSNLTPPLPPTPTNVDQNRTPILIWGASASTGQYLIQLLRYAGYTNILATSSPSHHPLLKSFGAAECLDYRSPSVLEEIGAWAKKSGGFKVVVDCIGSEEGSVKPLASIVNTPGAKVAIMLPVVKKETLSLTVEQQFKEGVEVIGIRTHFWQRNELFKTKLQTEIIPWVLEKGIVKANDVVEVEGEDMLARASKALDLVRRQQLSGKRAVFEVSKL